MSQRNLRSPSYLSQNAYGYCFRIRIPDDLTKTIGKKSLRFSLKTGKLGQAKSRARYLAGNIQMLFRNLRNGSWAVKDLTPDVINDLIRTYRDQVIERVKKPVNPNNPDPDSRDYKLSKLLNKSSGIEEYLNELNLIRQALEECVPTGEYHLVIDDAELLCRERGVHYEKDSDAFCKLCRGLLLAEWEATSMEMELFEGNPKVLMEHSHRPAPVEPQPVPEPEIDEGPLLSEVIEKYLNWQEKLPTDHAAKWNDPSAKASHRAALNLFVEFQGDIPINRIEKPDIIDFQDMLCEYPTGRNRLGSPYREMTLKEIQGMDIDETLMIPTINLYMNRVKLFFEYAEDRGFYKNRNPFPDKYRIKDGRGQAEKRARFSKAELETLFKSEEYKENLFDKPFKFWTPLIALFHGMRQKEIAQLYLSDIRKEDGIPVFSVVQDEEDKRVKNATSRRVVPIHPFILNDLKLMNYVEKLKSMGEERLFPELPFVKSSYGVKVGDWFREYKRSCGINPPKKAPKKDFHSLRKNFINLASQKNVPIEKRRAVTGHTLGTGVDSTTYVGDLPVKQLLDEVIAQIDFHKTLKLGFLKNSQFVIK